MIRRAARTGGGFLAWLGLVVLACGVAQTAHDWLPGWIWSGLCLGLIGLCIRSLAEPSR